MVFNQFAPTTQMLGRWQPWHDGHTALFKKALLETGQVCIQIRTVPKMKMLVLEELWYRMIILLL